jgi:hypothetical protein
MAGTAKPIPKISAKVSHKAPATASSTSKDARALRSGQALRDALLVLLLQKPFDQITIRDICATAGVHYATFSVTTRPRRVCSTRLQPSRSSN